MRIENLILNDKYEDNILVIDHKKKWSKKEIKTRINKMTLLLSNFEKQNNIGIICENGSEFLVYLFSAFCVNATVVPLDPNLPIDTMMKLLQEIDTKIVLISENLKKKLCNELKNHYVLLNERDADLFSPENSLAYGKNTNEDDVAFIFFSSGTTSGKPKGIQLTHKAIYSNMLAVQDYMQPNQSDIFFISKTFVHAPSLVCEVFVALYVGALIIAYSDIMAPVTMMERIEDTHATVLFVNPTILRLLTEIGIKRKKCIKVLRLIYTSGSTIEKELLEKAQAIFVNARIYNVYGLTEAGPRVCAPRIDCSTYSLGSVGKSIKGVRIKIINKDGKAADVNEKGIIYVQSQSMMEGYFKNQSLTKQKLSNGWLETGDVGYINNSGELFVLGRSDEIINRNSNNVDPILVENVIKKMEGIRECIVFGIPDKRYINKIVAAIIVEEGYTYTLKDIIKFSSSYLLPCEFPQELYIWDTIPLTISGKKSRVLAREKYEKLNNSN